MTAVRQHAAIHIEEGSVPIRVRSLAKNPIGSEWENARPTPDQFAENDNIGLLLGDVSRGLTDVDLDCDEAVFLAPWFLPDTGRAHGCEGDPRVTHRWYFTAESLGREQFKDPTRGVGKKQMIAELRRGTAARAFQTVIPPSRYEDGRVLEWKSDGDPATVVRAELSARVGRLATAALLARHWVEPRAECSLALTGALVRAGWSVPEAAQFAAAVAAWVNRNGDEVERTGQIEKRVAHAERAAAKLAAGESVTGFPRLVELGVPIKVAQTAHRWLGLPGHPPGYLEEARGLQFTTTGAGDADEDRTRIDLSSVVRQAQPAEPVRVAAMTLPPGASPPRVGVRCSSLVTAIVKQSKVTPVALPFPKLSEKLGGGLLPSELCIVVAPIGSGKTAFVAQVGAHHAERAPTIYYVGEMTPAYVAARIIAQRRGVSWRSVIMGGVSEPEMSEILEPLKLYFVERQENPMAGIEATLDLMQTNHPGETIMLVVDYVQLLADASKDMRLSTIQATRRLQTLTESRGLVTIALSQSSRGGARRIKDGASAATDLADTGAETSELERGASTQLALSFVPADDVETHAVTVLITKGRFSGGGRLGFSFHGPTGLWKETDEVPMTSGEAERWAAVFDMVKAHDEKRCACLGLMPLTANELTRAGHHKVVGRRVSVLATVRVMKERGAILEEHGRLVPRRGA